MATSGSKKKKQDGDGRNTDLKVSKQESTNQWVMSGQLRPLFYTVYGKDSEAAVSFHI